MKKYKNYLIAAAIALLVAFVAYKKVYIPKHTYKTVSPKVQDLSLDVQGIGEVGAKDIYKVSAGVNAKVVHLYSDLGRWVKKGELLFELDAVDLPTQLESAKTAIKKAQSEASSLQKELESLKAQKRLAEVTFKRYARLKKESFASQAEYDQAKAQLDSLQAQINATKARIESAKIAVEIARKNAKALAEKLARFKVYAPVSGLVVAKNAEVGQTLLASQAAFEIVKKEDVWVKAYVDERQSKQIKVGKKAYITLRSNENKKLKGYVARIVPKSDAVTQEREVDVAFAKVPVPFYLNEQAKVHIQTQVLHNVVTIPAELLRFENGSYGVWVNQNYKAHFQKVTLLGISGKRAAVKGLEAKAVLLDVRKRKDPLFEGKKILHD